ncbi:hypothetical protein D9M72_645310 [compost metagenome]
MERAKPAGSANAGASTRSVAPSVLPRMVRNTKDSRGTNPRECGMKPRMSAGLEMRIASFMLKVLC